MFLGAAAEKRKAEKKATGKAKGKKNKKAKTEVKEEDTSNKGHFASIADSQADDTEEGIHEDDEEEVEDPDLDGDELDE